jgi:tetratricopeptide (TPR) repeat protein
VSNEYRTLFDAYLSTSLQETIGQVARADPLVPEEVRQQAWHLLSYAFALEPTWPLTSDLLLKLAPKMEQAGLRGEWIPYLEQGLCSAQAQGDVKMAAECQLCIGHLYRLQSEFSPARQWLTKSLADFVAACDDHGQARALNQLAYVDYLQHRYGDADRFVNQALDLLEADHPERAMSYFVQGMIAIDHKRWQEAEAYHRLSLALREKQGDQRRIAWSLQNLGYALRGQGRFGEAITCYQQAGGILYSIGDAYNKAHVEMNLGLAYLHSEHPLEALAYFTTAAQTFHKLGDRLQLARLHTNLGLAHMALHDWGQAENAFVISIDLFQALGNVSARLNATDGLAMTYLAQKQFVKASSLLEQAIALLSTSPTIAHYDYLVRSLTNHLQEAKQGIAQGAIPA